MRLNRCVGFPIAPVARAYPCSKMPRRVRRAVCVTVELRRPDRDDCRPHIHQIRRVRRDTIMELRCAVGLLSSDQTMLRPTVSHRHASELGTVVVAGAAELFTQAMT